MDNDNLPNEGQKDTESPDNNPYDPNESFGPYFDEKGNQITFLEWFYGGEPIKKKAVYGRLIWELKISSMRPVVMMTLAMLVLLVYKQQLPIRIFVSTADLDNIGASVLRSFGSLFMHADMSHLGSNLVLFFPFSWLLANYFGKLAFPVSALIAGTITNYLTVYLYAQNGYQTSLVGASGMVYAIVAQWAVLYFRYENRYSVQIKLMRTLGVLMMLLIPTTYSPKTSYLAHGIGFAVGLLASIPFLFLDKGDKQDS